MNWVESKNYLSDLIKQICHGSEDDWKRPETVEKYANEFASYYHAGYYNLYSASYSWIAGSDPATMDYLEDRLTKIQYYLKENDILNDEELKKFIKLHDYISLEASRAANIENVNKHIQTSRTYLSKMEDLEKSIKETQKDSASQTITVLSIFTGIAMAFFGGFSLLGSAFDNIAYGLPSAAIMAILVGIILFNTVFSFIYFASRISGRSITSCGGERCDECKKPCETDGKAHIFKKFYRKYPYIVFVNTLLLILLVLFSLAYIFLPYHGFPEAPKTQTIATAETAQLPCNSINIEIQ